MVGAAGFEVVIATRDRPGLLLACLESLDHQTAGPVRTIVVDDASKIPVSASVPGAATVLRNERPLGPAGSRNRGVEAAQAEHVLFLDDDVRAHPDLLAAHAQAFRDNPGGLVSIGALFPPSGVRLPPWDHWLADRLVREQGTLERGEVDTSWRHLYTGNVALRVADFRAVGSFAVEFPRQEDIELGYRLAELGCRFTFTQGAVVWHNARHSLDDWLRIPAASARDDLLMDRLRPGSGRLAMVSRDMRERHWLLRAARRAAGRPAAGRAVERLAIAAGSALHRVRADRLALPAFSLVWDLEYRRALAAEARRPPAVPSPP